MRPREDVKRELVQQWAAKADADMKAAHVLMRQESGLLGIVGFHCQQAAEKYIKAFLVAHGVKFPKTHDLQLLSELAGKTEAALADALQESFILSDYGVEVRYPADIPDLSVEEAQEAVRLAESVRELISAALADVL